MHSLCLKIEILTQLRATTLLKSSGKGQSSRSPIIGPVNKSCEAVFLNAVSVFCQN